MMAANEKVDRRQLHNLDVEFKIKKILRKKLEYKSLKRLGVCGILICKYLFAYFFFTPVLHIKNLKPLKIVKKK